MSVSPLPNGASIISPCIKITIAVPEMMIPDRLHVSQNALVQHFITLMRDRQCPSVQFRYLASQIAIFLTYEVMGQKSLPLPVLEVEGDTPDISIADGEVVEGQTYKGVFVDSNQCALIALMRSGQVLASSAHPYFPNAMIGHIGFRFAFGTTERMKSFYRSLPDLTGKFCFVYDSDIATGASISHVIEYMVSEKSADPDRIAVIATIAARPGIDRLHSKYPVHVFVAACDEEVRAGRSIYPGVGRFQKRMFGFEVSDAEKFDV